MSRGLPTVELRFRIKAPRSIWFVGDYFVCLWIADHILNLALGCIGGYRIIQRASMQAANTSSGIFESPENISEK
jgi:hypothetical protein